jgi:hypothetical protein
VETGCPAIIPKVCGDRMSLCNSNTSVERGWPAVALTHLWRKDDPL